MKNALGIINVSVVGLLFALACGKAAGGGDSETNWLKSCTADADCGSEGACLCGVCTVDCSSAGDCAGLPGAVSCVESSSVGCGSGATSPGVCLTSCGGDDSCGDGFECAAGSCRPSNATGGGGEGGAMDGTGGAPPAGMGGTAGGPPEAPLDDSQCANPTQVSSRSSCSDAETRAYLQCGAPISRYDENCCQRTMCSDDAQCGAGELCVPTVLEARSCGRGPLFMCSAATGECVCGDNAVCDQTAYCMSAEAVRCEVASRSCDLLASWGSWLDDYAGLAAIAEPVRERVTSCAESVAEELAARCP